MTQAPLRLVIFDCDGVLVDSEAAASRVCAEEISALGWNMTAEDSMARFVGMRLSDMPPIIEAETGRSLPPFWAERLRLRLIDVLEREAEPVPGAAAVLQATTAMGLAFRVASNSSHEEMAVKFARTGLASLVAGRLHSARDVGVGKPAPDLFLAAAAAEGVGPENCLVIEDSLPGVEAARAASMACIGFMPQGDGAHLRGAGAITVRALSDLPPLFRAAMRSAA